MNKKIWITNIITNSLIVALMIVAVLMMFFGDGGVLASSRWSSFKYFTIQSNVFAGLASLFSLIYILVKRKEEYPGWLAVIKLVSVTSVGVTFVVVMTYLGAVYGYPFLFNRANLFLHGIIPVLAIVFYILFEPKMKLKFTMNLYSMIPVTIYGIIYLANVAAKNDYGNYKGADWYAFGTYGLGIGVLCLFIIIILEFGLSVGIYFLHQKTTIKKLHE